MSTRNLFGEMMQGIDEMTAQREGKIPLPADSHDSWFRAKVRAELEDRKKAHHQDDGTELI